MRSRLNVKTVCSPSQTYSWYLNHAKLTSFAPRQHRVASPRITVHMNTGSKFFDAKALKPQSGHNKVFWRSLLPGRGMLSTLVITSLVVCVFKTFVSCLWTPTSGLALSTFLFTVSALQPLTLFTLMLLAQALRHSIRTEARLAFAWPLSVGAKCLVAALTLLLSLVGAYRATASCDSNPRISNLVQTPCGALPVDGATQLVKFHAPFSNTRHKNIEGCRILVPVFRVNTDSSVSGVWVHATSTFMGLTGGTKYTPKLAAGLIADTPASLTIVRLTSPSGLTRSFARAVSAQQLFARTQAVRLLLSSWHTFNEVSLTSSTGSNVTGVNKPQLYSNNLRASKQYTRPKVSMLPLSEGSIPLLSADGALSAEAQTPVFTYKRPRFQPVALQSSHTSFKTKPWGRL